MMYHKIAELKKIYPFEFDQEHIAWKNFANMVQYNLRDKNRVYKSRLDWIHDLNTELTAYNAVCNYEWIVCFKSKADLTFFLLRFS